MNHEPPGSEEHKDALESYAGGDIQSRHGVVNKWLLAVYAVLFGWAIYYLAGPFEGWRPTFGFWGGLGPGLANNGTEGLSSTGVIAFWLVLISIFGFFAWVAILTWRK